MKEMILGLLETESKAWELSGIAGHLNIAVDEAQKTLDTLLRDGQAILTKKGKYTIPRAMGLITARAQVLRSGTLVARSLDDRENLPIRLIGRLRCLSGDIILVRPDSHLTNGARHCELVMVTRHAHETFSAVLSVMSAPIRKEKTRQKPKKKKQPVRGENSLMLTAKPYDRSITCDIRLEGDLLGARNGDMVVLQTVAWPEQGRPLLARVLRVMGDAEHLAVQLKAIAEDHDFETSFPDEAAAQAAGFPDHVQEQDMEGRLDLRSLVLFTIDGEDAKDFDDAVSLEKLPDGAWQLGVHIADVSHYVAAGQPLDQEALRRGTSLYLPGLTLPMLPDALSSHLCSLMPDVDRLAMSLFMKIQSGNILSHQLAPSVIHSSARLTYTQVNRLLNGEENSVPQPLHKTLEDMLALSHDLRETRRKRGSIDFDLSETGFTLNANHEPIDVHARERGEAERLIEDFMLAANETVAQLAQSKGLPFVYRIHEKPDADKLYALELFLQGLNLPARIGQDPHPRVLQELVAKTAQNSNADIIRMVMIRSLKRACYSEKPEGHYALATKDYCHFTSPIRRYPDLQVHRMLKKLLAGKAGSSEQQTKRMAELAAQCSQREYAATSAEREGDDLLKAHYMSKHIGEQFDGIVSGVTGWGFYVTLPNTVEGLVSISSLDDYYIYDDKHSTLIGQRTGHVIRLGDSVQVQVSRADTVRREVDFQLITSRSKIWEDGSEDSRVIH